MIMLLSKTIEGNNYKIIGHDLEPGKAHDILSPGTALRVVMKYEGWIVIHSQGKRFSVPPNHTLKIRVNPI